MREIAKDRLCIMIEQLNLILKYAIVYHYRGVAKSALGREEEAIEDYNKAIGLF